MQKLSKEQKNDLVRIIVSFVLFAALIIAEHTGLIPKEYLSSPWMLFAYIVPYLIVGYDVLIKCFKRIARGQLFDETFLMSLATFGAFATGEYTEAVAVMLFYQVGEFFQDYAVGKSRESIAELVSIAPDYANVLREDGSIDSVDPDEVNIGDIIIVRAGEKIPVDGTVVEGEGPVNTSALTGESMPMLLTVGDQALSGCINGDSILKIRADKEYDDSTVAQIIELVENASSKKSKTEAFITRFAKYYTPCVVIAAVLLAFIPPIFVGNISDWIMRACSFLVISCPCAIVISVPMAFFGGIGAASNIGVLVKGSNYLEMMAQLEVLVTDKTGTITEGKFKVNNIDACENVSKEHLLRLAASVESNSTHPIAASIVEAYSEECKEPLFTAEEVTNISGKGLTAYVEGVPVIIGNGTLMQENGVTELPESIGTAVYIMSDGIYIGMIELRDMPKDGMADDIKSIKSYGVKRVVMLTGDSEDSAKAVADEVGISEYRYGLLPQDKVTEVESILEYVHSSGKGNLAFVGDGINDAPVLARADVGIAMGSLGSDAAIEAADIVIMDDRFDKIPRTIDVSRKTVKISKMNIVFALGVKAICLVLGAIGIVGMWAAVFADVGVAIICIGNSMRMLVIKP